MPNKQLNVLIIGAGRIGAFFDNPKHRNILTHAHAFTLHKDFNLLGFVDSNLKKAKEAAKRWNCLSFQSVKEAFDNFSIDIVSLCTPDKFHLKQLVSLVQFSPRLVFSEKPLVQSIEEAKLIINLYKKKKIPLLVNFTRRFVPEFQSLSKSYKNGAWGNFIKGNAYYGKGLLHNGSHLLDLLSMFFTKISIESIIRAEYDFSHTDPSLSMILNINKKPFAIQSISESFYTVFEVDLLFEKKRIRFTESGLFIEEYNVIPSREFTGYKYIKKISTRKTSLHFSLYYAADNISNFLKKKVPLLSPPENSYNLLNICFSKKNKKKNNEQKNTPFF